MGIEDYSLRTARGECTKAGLQDPWLHTEHRMMLAERKEELQRKIEDQIELGGSGLDEQDRYLLEINLEDLETSTGEDQYYWLIAIRAARADRILRRRQQESVAGERSSPEAQN